MTSIYVWHVALVGSAAEAASLEPLLEVPLRSRLARLVRPEDRRRFTLRQLAYRRILMEHLDLGGPVLVQYLEDGRPYLAGMPRFSWSSTGDDAIVAIISSGEVGADVERLSVQSFTRQMMMLAANEIEFEWLLSNPPEKRSEEFLRLWVRKEAVLKAMGVGLRRDPRSITVINSDEVTDLISGTNWRMCDLEIESRTLIASIAIDWSELAPVISYNRLDANASTFG